MTYTTKAQRTSYLNKLTESRVPEQCQLYKQHLTAMLASTKKATRLASMVKLASAIDAQCTDMTSALAQFASLVMFVKNLYESIYVTKESTQASAKGADTLLSVCSEQTGELDIADSEVAMPAADSTPPLPVLANPVTNDLLEELESLTPGNVDDVFEVNLHIAVQETTRKRKREDLQT